MDQITLTFPNPLNVSVQIGDIAYFTNSNNSYEGPEIKIIGQVLEINQSNNSIVCEISPSQERPVNTSFILFSKDNTQNTGSVLGYFAKLQFRNGSKDYAEIFSVGTEVFESSK